MIFFRKIRFGKLTDSELLIQYHSTGNAEYVGELFSRYSHLVFGVCLYYLKNRNDAKDAVLSIFEKVISELKKQELNNFKNWLYSVSRNHCLLQIRSKSRLSLREKIFADENFNEEENGIEPDENISNSVLYAAINDLKDEQKVCVELFYLDEKSYQEITALTGFSFEQVKSHIQNGKRNLKIMLSKSYEKE